MALTPFTVSQVNDFISRMFKTEPLLRPVLVIGEITYLNFHSNGNIYFSVSDTSSKLDCVMFNNKITPEAMDMELGKEVILSGNIESFPMQSKYSLWVNSVEYAGEGEQSISFEKMKEKLNKEGLFNPEHKKELPEYPKHIGVITSKTGAAIRDILKILTDRTSLTDVTIFPSMVQGPNAAESMIEMLDIIQEDYIDEIDLIILGRGGGSKEDLSPFNDENLARAIYKCPIPIISAVGHEIDTSISDLVADLRAETPTAAAQIAVKSREEIDSIMGYYLENLNQYISNKLMQKEFEIDASFNSIKDEIFNLINQYDFDIEKYGIILDENNPKKILNKGYSFVSDVKGKPITKSGDVKKGKSYNITFKDGKAQVIGE